MNSLSLISMFMIGLLGSVHCIGMCGGIVGAFSLVPAGAKPRKPFPVGVRTSAQDAGMSVMLRTISYNMGRIASYALAGAIVGGIVGSGRLLAGMTLWQTGAYVFAHAMLIALGLYLMNVWHGLSRLEQLGNHLWKRIQPLTALLLPLDSPIKLMLAGSLWGWLPCGMVYSVLLTAMLSGLAMSGAAVMLAFGLDTLPVEEGAAWLVRIDNVERAMCCSGCKAVAESIVGNGFSDYYASRSGFAATLARQDLIPPELQLYDDTAVIAGADNGIVEDLQNFRAVHYFYFC